MAINDPILPQTPPPIPGAQPPALPPELVLGRTTKYELPADQPPPESWDGTPLAGRGRTPIWLWVVTLALLAVLIVKQRPEAEKPSVIQDQAAGVGTIQAPKVDQFVLIGKLAFGLRDMFRQDATALPGEDPVQKLIQVSDGMAGWKGKDSSAPPSATNPPEKPKEPEAAADRLRAAIIAAEFLPAKEVDWRLKDIESDLNPFSPLNDDVRIVRDVYGIGKDADDAGSDGSSAAKPSVEASTSPAGTLRKNDGTSGDGLTREQIATARAATAALSPQEFEDFRSRHGEFFGDLVLNRGGSYDVTRGKAASDGQLLLLVFALAGGLVLIGGFIGLVLLVVGSFFGINGRWRWRFRRPAPETEWPVTETGSQDASIAVNTYASRHAHPSSIWLETVAVFFAMFLCVKGLGWLLENYGKLSKDHYILAVLGLQWLVALAIFWPIVRGMSWQRWRADIGWHKGQGVFREIGAGICGYLACLPLYFCMAMVVVIATFLWSLVSGSETKPPAGNKIGDLLEASSGFGLVLLFLLATVWAPVVEESIFRGCLFRHLRRRVPMIVAALGSAFVFAVLHGYIVQGLFMVGTLGFWFALMREWRGSIIATATAHAIHNGTVMLIMLSVVSIAKN